VGRKRPRLRKKERKKKEGKKKERKKKERRVLINRFQKSEHSVEKNESSHATLLLR